MSNTINNTLLGALIWVAFVDGFSNKDQLTEFNFGLVLYFCNLTASNKKVKYITFDYESAVDQQKILSINLGEVEKKIEELEEDYYVGKKIPDTPYSRLLAKLEDEKKKINESLANLSFDSSNLKKCYAYLISISIKLVTVWPSMETANQELLQKLVFPEGIYYNRKKEAFLTGKINMTFSAIPSLNKVSGGDKEKQYGIKAVLSSLVGKTGLAPLILKGGGLKQNQHSPSGFLPISPSAFEPARRIWLKTQNPRYRGGMC